VPQAGDQFEKGFSEQNLNKYRKFYLVIVDTEPIFRPDWWKIGHCASGLTWSH